MVHRKTHIIFIVYFLFLLASGLAQEQKIADSLATVYLQKSLGDEDRFRILTDLSFNEINDLKKGLQYAEELISLSEKTGNDNYLRIGYFLKGTKKRLLGNLEEALQAYIQSAQIATQINHVKGEAEAYCAIADAYTVANDPVSAKQYYRKAIGILQKSTPRSPEDSINLASVLTNAGETFRKARTYDSAILYSNQAKSIFDAVGYPIGVAYCLGNIGMVYASIGKNDLAAKNLNEAIPILEKAQDYYPICDYLIAFADVYIDKGDDRTALDYALQSLDLSERHRLKEQISNASLKLSQLYEKGGNSAKAFKYFKDHITYRDSLNNVKLVQDMANLRTNYEVSQKQAEVNLLKSEKKRQKTMVIGLFVILGLTILLWGSLYRSAKSKAKEKMRLHQQELLAAKLEVQEQTYLNISQELHDNIGQVLSLVKMNISTIGNVDSDLAREKLGQSATLIAKAIRDIRDMSKTLNTDFLNAISLPNAIDQQLEVLKRTGMYATELSVAGEEDQYEPAGKLIVFRVVQELLNNVVKHANANKVVVSMSYEPDKLVIKVNDNGRGFNAESQAVYPEKGLGLRNIYTRLKLIKGSIAFTSEPNQGTTATIEIAK